MPMEISEQSTLTEAAVALRRLEAAARNALMLLDMLTTLTPREEEHAHSVAAQLRNALISIDPAALAAQQTVLNERADIITRELRALFGELSIMRSMNVTSLQEASMQIQQHAPWNGRQSCDNNKEIVEAAVLLTHGSDPLAVTKLYEAVRRFKERHRL